MDAESVKFAEWLKNHNACSSSYTETRGKSLSEWWDSTERPEWMVWVLRRLSETKNNKALMVAISIKCAKSVLHLVPDGELRPKKAIDAAEKWLAEPTEENRKAANAAANAAAYAANVNAYAAYTAAYAANAAANAAYAANVNAYAADAAAYAAYAAANANAYAAYAADAARKAKRVELCAEIRQLITPTLD
jgi:hypothetical protein